MYFEELEEPPEVPKNNNFERLQKQIESELLNKKEKKDKPKTIFENYHAPRRPSTATSKPRRQVQKKRRRKQKKIKKSS